MIIEYQVKRLDLIKSIFHNLRHSGRTRRIFFGIEILYMALFLFFRYLGQGHLFLYDFIFAFIFTLGLILAILALALIITKTQKRAWIINPEGIETKIGSVEGKIAWNLVDSITVTPERILITGKNANAFVVTSSAFTNAEQRQKFIDLAVQYHANANS